MPRIERIVSEKEVETIRELIGSYRIIYEISEGEDVNIL